MPASLAIGPMVTFRGDGFSPAQSSSYSNRRRIEYQPIQNGDDIVLNANHAHHNHPTNRLGDSYHRHPDTSAQSQNDVHQHRPTTETHLQHHQRYRPHAEASHHRVPQLDSDEEPHRHSHQPQQYLIHSKPDNQPRRVPQHQVSDDTHYPYHHQQQNQHREHNHPNNQEQQPMNDRHRHLNNSNGDVHHHPNLHNDPHHASKEIHQLVDRPKEGSHQHHLAVLSALIEHSRPSRLWQEPLRKLLGGYLMETEAQKAMGFLEHVLLEAKAHRQSHPNASKGCLPVDTSLAPSPLDLDLFNTILIVLGYEIEEPDGPHKLEHVSYIRGPTLLMPVLDGMLQLLVQLKDLHWNLFRWVLGILSTKEAEILKSLAKNSTETNPREEESTLNFFAKFPDEMRQLGYQKVNKTICLRSGPKTSLQLQLLYCCLFGLFQEENNTGGAVDV